METLFAKLHDKLKNTQTGLIRDFIDQVPWKNRMIGIKGARGSVKTTLLLQYIKTKLKGNPNVLYCSLDDLYFSMNRLVDLTDDFVKRGGEHLLIDEVHRYPGWSGELKNIYDDHPGLKIVFTGSSIIDLKKAEADLSRRALLFELPGLSFRESLNFRMQKKYPAYSLEDILKQHVELTKELLKDLLPMRELPIYLRNGYYPYVFEDEENYLQRLAATINISIETDIPSFIDLPFSNIVKLKKLLYLIAVSVPFKPNIQRLSETTGMTRNTIIQYLHLLDDARMISLLYSDVHGIGYLQKPEKIYLHHPNLMYALNYNITETGAVRETFLLNQLLPKHQITYPAHGDFLIDGKHTIEVGGKHKKQKQIKTIPGSYLAADNIEYGFDRKIPLWLFGFLY
jgi:predicted AAA+ superfamily ATPase